MTKELNLFLGETKEPATNKTKTETKTEKTGSSLFDNILSNIKEEKGVEKNNTVNTENRNNQIPTSKVETETKTNTVENKMNVPNNVETKNSTTKADTNNEDIKTNQNINNNAVKNEKSSMSLLDRMMIEANSKINSNDNEKVKTTPEKIVDSNLTQLDEKMNEKVQKTQKINSENGQLETNTKKEKIDKTEENKNIKNANTSNNTNNEKSLFDTILSEAKNTDIKNTETTLTQTTKTVDNETHDLSKKENLKAENKSNSANISNEQTVQNTESIVKNTQNVDVETKEKQNNDMLKENIKPQTLQKDNVNSDISKEFKIDNTVYLDENKNSESIVEKNRTAVDVTQNKKENITVESINDNFKTEVTLKTEVTQKAETVQKAVIKQDVPKENVTVSKKETEVIKIINDEIQTTKTVESSVIKNEKVANELSKITKTEIETKVNISKDEIEKLPEQSKSEKSENNDRKEKSLLDRLVEESKQLAKNTNKEVIKADIPKTNESSLKQNIEKNINPFVTNMYLSSQKNSLNEASIVKVSTGKKMASEASSVNDIEKSAKFLDLGLEDTEVTVKVQDLEKHTKLNILDKLAFAKTVMKQDFINNNSEIVSKQTASTAITSVIKNENELAIQLNVSPSNVMNIESRIIGARQQMGPMMSDVARNMYLNYKPPVTAFRINLTPGTLGSIAIVMKSDKENGLSISLNMSNSATLDSFVDNQSSLRAALAKNFNTEGSLTLDFNMQKQNDGDSDSSNQQNNHSGNSKKEDDTAIQNITNSETQENINSDYM